MTAAAELAVEGKLPELDDATAWLNSEPLMPADLRGKPVVEITFLDAGAQAYVFTFG